MITRVLAVLVAALLCVNALAADKGKKDKPAKFAGVLSAKAADAPAGVVAVLTIKKDDVEKKCNLLADGDLATKLADLAGKGASVTVMGTETADGIKVTDVEEKAAGKKEGGHKKPPKGGQ